MFEQLDHTPIPEYIPIYHALDWLTIDELKRPYKMRYHAIIAEELRNMQERRMQDAYYTDELERVDFEDIAERRSREDYFSSIKMACITNKISLYHKTFDAIYNRPLAGVVKKLDIPDDKIDIDNLLLISLDDEEAEWGMPSYSNSWRKMITPACYQTIEYMMERENFQNISSEDRDGYMLTSSNFSYYHEFSINEYNQHAALIYLKVDELKEFIKQLSEANEVKQKEDMEKYVKIKEMEENLWQKMMENKDTKVNTDNKKNKKGREKKYYSIRSFIAYLQLNKVDLSKFKGKQFDLLSFMQAIKCENIDISFFEKEKQISFATALLNKNLGSERLLKQHYNEIKQTYYFVFGVVKK